MPPIWSAFRSSSSASTSPSDSPHKDQSKRRLTRLRKLRHVSEDELGLRQVSLPASPETGSRSSSPHHWSRSAMPQPLPLPELRSVQRSSKSNDNSPSPSKRIPSSAPLTSTSSSCTTLGTSTDDVARRSCETPTYRRRGFPMELSVEGVGYNFRLNNPARSAPSSGLSSPVLSPKRFSTVDLFHSSFDASSAFEASCWDRTTVSSQVWPARVSHSLDHSPIQSPTSNNHSTNRRKQTGLQLQSFHKSLSEAGLEGNNANVHPLPLPPGASRTSQPSFMCQQMGKSNVTSLAKGQWKKGKLIGRGTYGSVYLATNRETGALCAMKEVDLIPDDPKAAECIAQLEQEMKVLRQLKHPNIVQYYGSEIIEDRFCIYLEYVHPGSINKYVHEHCRAMTESVVRNFTRHIVSGLTYLHSKKKIHRDIKGANLLVDAHGVVKLADFGLAKHLSGRATDLSLKGSPHWMAPEVLQAAMRKDANPELAFGIDIWGLGCTVIEMLTGKPPWCEFSTVQAMFNVLNKSPPIPAKLSSEGKDFLQCCFQRKPQDRPTAARLLEHPFLQNSHDQNFATCEQEYCPIRLSALDKLQSPKGDWRNHNKDLMPISPSTCTRNGELPYNRYVIVSSLLQSPRTCSCMKAYEDILERVKQLLDIMAMYTKDVFVVLVDACTLILKSQILETPPVTLLGQLWKFFLVSPHRSPTLLHKILSLSNVPSTTYFGQLGKFISCFLEYLCLK